MRAIIVCGSRDLTDEESIRSAVSASKPDVLIHGDARGADAVAHRVGASLALEVIPMPAQWTRDGKSAGPKRNRRMLDVLLALRECGYRVAVLAFPLGESRGTRDMMAAAHGVGVRVFTWDGELVEWVP